MEDGGPSAGDNQDWDWEEVLVPQSDNHQLHHNANPNLRSLPNSDEEEEGLEGEGSFTDGDVICPDYFSIDNDHRLFHHESPTSEEGLEKGIDSDSGKHGCSQCDEAQFGGGSWMDPGQFRVGKRRRNYSSSSSESSDSSSGGGSGSGSGSRNHLLTLQTHSECTHHSHFHDYDYKEGFSGHTLEPFDPLAKSRLGEDSHGNGNGAGTESGFEIESQAQKEGELESPNGGAQNSHSSEFSSDKDDKDVHVNMAVQEEAEKEDIKSSPENENEKRSVAWWRVPLEMLKYCVLRVSPVWSLSVAAAAIMGFVLYRRRWLSKMKRKSQGLHLNITVDDKKVSQFTSRAARLNEAFSVVKRVPIIRPSLPAPGLAPWPVMSLR